jgi:molybdate transport system substrate-binding protein
VAAAAERLIRIRFPVCLYCLIFCCTPVTADIARIAVASNFKPTLVKLIAAFSLNSTHRFKVSSGSTGMLYAQITNGAPFDIFLAADRATPALLEQNGLIEPGSRRTYAVGKLVLWVPGASSQVDELYLTGFDGTIAIANPELAPYGFAAMSLIQRLDNQHFRIVKGNNVAQAFQFVVTRNAAAGLVALSQIRNSNIDSRLFWIVTQNYYDPIDQQLVILKPTDAGRDFISFLATDEAGSILSNDGYSRPPPRRGPKI